MPHVHAPGLVLRLDPKTLAQDGASYTGDDDTELTPQQYWVCIDSNPKDALWVPLFAAPGPQRRGIPETAKSGNGRWTKYSSFYDGSTICRVAHKGAARAAEVAYDESTPKAPNRIAVAHVPKRAEFPADTALRPMTGNTTFR